VWRRISPDHPEFKNVESLAVDPLDPRVIYVGTWHLPWKTTDGGKTWALIGNNAVGMVDDSDIFSILVDRQNSSLVYMSTCTGIYRSENGGRLWSKIQGIPTTSRRTHVIRQHASRPEILVAGTTQGLWKSTDHGRRWRLVTARNLVINDVAFPLVKKDVVLLATNQGVFMSENGAPFLASNNGFSHWTVADIQIDRENPKRLYAGLFSTNSTSGIYVSEDQSDSWRELGEGLSGVGVFTILQLPHAPEVIYAGTGQGLYMSGDRGSHWRRVFPKQVWSLVPGRWSLAKTKTNHEPRTTDQGRRTKDDRPSATYNPRAKILALSQYRRPGESLLLTEQALYLAQLEQGVWQELYQSRAGERLLCVTAGKQPAGTVYLGSNKGLRISLDAGRTWEWLLVANQEYQVQAVAEGTGESGTLYVGTPFGLFRLLKRDGIVSWTRCGNGLPPISISAIAFNPRDESELVVGDQRHGGLYQSLDGGEHWKRIDSGFASTRVSTLTFDRQSLTSLYVGTLNGGTYLGRRGLLGSAPSTLGEGQK
jgi:photosystem II stability/assembly factor-like uncharacterized protein